VGLVALVGVVAWVSHSTIFDLRELRVRGNHHLSHDQVAALAGLSSHTNLVWTSPGAIERRLEADPWVQSATVSRTLPSSLVVEVRERTPVAVAGTRLIAADGTVLGPAPDAVRLPTLSGPLGPVTQERVGGAAPQLSVVRAVPPQLLGRVDQVRLEAGGLLSVLMRGDLRVVFGGPDDALAKWDALASVLTWARTHGVTPASIDVRAPSSPSLRVSVDTPAGAASDAESAG
jgi:cell division protein FtsQ